MSAAQEKWSPGDVLTDEAIPEAARPKGGEVLLGAATGTMVAAGVYAFGAVAVEALMSRRSSSIDELSAELMAGMFAGLVGGIVVGMFSLAVIPFVWLFARLLRVDVRQWWVCSLLGAWTALALLAPMIGSDETPSFARFVAATGIALGQLGAGLGGWLVGRVPLTPSPLTRFDLRQLLGLTTAYALYCAVVAAARPSGEAVVILALAPLQMTASILVAGEVWRRVAYPKCFT